MTEVEANGDAVPELKDEMTAETSVVEESSPPQEEGEGDSIDKTVEQGKEEGGDSDDPSGSATDDMTDQPPATSKDSTSKENPKKFRRNSSSFLRVSDLDLPSADETASADENPEGSADGDDDEMDQLSHFHHPSADPPPGVDKDDKEKWIALGSHDGVPSPIAPLAVQKLAEFALETALKEEMWKPDRKTQRFIQRATPDQDWMTHTFAPGAFFVGDSCNFHEKEVFVWTGSFTHDYYGCDLPTIRVSGTVNMSAEDLVNLLLDSSRVKEYNRLMIKREDIQVFADNLNGDNADIESNPFGACIAKFTRAESKPPLVNRLMIFNNLCYAKKLPDEVGYLVCNRAIYNSKEPEDEPANSIKSEVLLGVNLIRHLKDKEGNILPDKCVMTNVNHMRSPKIPLMIARKIGTNAAIGYLNDFRGAAERLAAQKE